MGFTTRCDVMPKRGAQTIIIDAIQNGVRDEILKITGKTHVMRTGCTTQRKKMKEAVDENSFEKVERIKASVE